MRITYSRAMGQPQNPAKRSPPNDWNIVVGWVGAILLVVFLIGCPLYRKAKHERFRARAEKAFGHLPALQKVAGEVEAEFRRADAGSTVDVGVSLRGAGKPGVGETIDLEELASVDRFELAVRGISEEDVPQLNRSIASALARHHLERVRVLPFMALPERSIALDGREIRMPAATKMGETYTVTAAEG